MAGKGVGTLLTKAIVAIEALEQKSRMRNWPPV